MPNFIPRHFLISESINCPFSLCFAQYGTHQDQIWIYFYRQSSLSLSFRAGISAAPASQTSSEGHLWLLAPSHHSFPCTEKQKKELKTSTFTFSAKVHRKWCLHFCSGDSCCLYCSLNLCFNKDSFAHEIWKAYKIELHLYLILPWIRTFSPESIPLEMHIFKICHQRSLAFLPDQIRAFFFMLYHHKPIPRYSSPEL